MWLEYIRKHTSLCPHPAHPSSPLAKFQFAQHGHGITRGGRSFLAGVRRVRRGGVARRRRHPTAHLLRRAVRKAAANVDEHGQGTDPRRHARVAARRRDAGVHLRRLLPAPRVVRREALPLVSIACISSNTCV